ncbi:MAG: NBR1-Ig-like domain-containing protein, partial [Anaerolineaceae bacterium]
TVEAMTTQIVASQVLPTQPISPTGTQPVMNPTPAPSQSPQAATTTPLPTETPTATLPCDQAEFVTETIPDGSQFFFGSVFTKTWTLRNAGSCTWTSSYEVEYTEGNLPDILTYQKFTSGSVAPGQTVTVSLSITVPDNAGEYRADFKLRNASGTTFSFKNPDKTFWIEIQAVSGHLNLADNFCAAEWTSGVGILPCPGKAGDAKGFVISDPAPVLENGYQDDEIALWLGVQSMDNGYIQGTYPAMKIPAGSKFEAIIGCEQTAKTCDALIALNYREGSGAMQTLTYWNETNDGAFHKVSYDLSALAGKNVQLILIVDAHGSAQGDKVHLLQPVIIP